MSIIYRRNSSLALKACFLCAAFILSCNQNIAKDAQLLESDGTAVFTDADTQINSSTESETGTRIDSETDTLNNTDSFECNIGTIDESCSNGWCLITPGCYSFGSPTTEATDCRAFSSETQVSVRLTRPFLISQSEITQQQWTDSGFPLPYPAVACPDCPISTVNWFDALAYCNELSRNEQLESCYDLSSCTGRVGAGCIDELCKLADPYKCTSNVIRFSNIYECPGYRLPTNAEWQYAARAGTTTATYNGELQNNGGSLGDCIVDATTAEVAWDCSNTDQKPMPVGLKEKNAFGLYDMLGNVREWNADPFRNTKLGADSELLTDPYGFTDDETESTRVASGGSYMEPTCLSRAATNGGRSGVSPYPYLGFRPVRTIFEEEK